MQCAYLSEDCYYGRDVQASAHYPRQSRLATKIAVLVVSVLVSGLMIEGALRLSGRIQVAPERVTTSRPQMYQAHPPFGYRLWPSRTLTYLYPRDHPRTLTVRSNRHGFRGEREFDAPDFRPRVVVLGDSMVFGEGVEEEERFTDQLEKLAPKWRVDNLGMTGFGPDLMLRVLEEVGLALKPRVVILTIYTDDFRRVRADYVGAGFEIPRFTLQSGRLVTIAYPVAHGWRRSRTLAAIREVAWRISNAERRLNAAILDQFRENASRHGFTLALVFLPGTYDTPNDVARRGWLRDYALRSSTPFLDLTEPLLTKPSEPLFIRNNWHLNPAGHLVIATELGRWLDRLS